MGTQISRLSIPSFQVVAGAAAERFLGRFLTRPVWALLAFHSRWQILGREEPYNKVRHPTATHNLHERPAAEPSTSRCQQLLASVSKGLGFTPSKPQKNRQSKSIIRAVSNHVFWYGRPIHRSVTLPWRGPFSAPMPGSTPVIGIWIVVRRQTAGFVPFSFFETEKAVYRDSSPQGCSS